MSDRVYRYGGEEFIAIYVFGNIDGGLRAADRMRQAVEDLDISHPGRPGGGVVTLSGGVVCYTGEESMTPSELIEWADKSLYEAKTQGKNKVIAG
jgi:diguanylate cyclase (GGDEF)-like protein